MVAALLVGLLSIGLAGTARGETADQWERRAVLDVPGKTFLLAQASPPTRPANPPVTRTPARGAAPVQSNPIAINQPRAESVTQQIRVEDGYALATATVRWQAEKGQVLPLVYNPAVLTRVAYPTNAVKLVPAVAGGRFG